MEMEHNKLPSSAIDPVQLERERLIIILKKKVKEYSRNKNNQKGIIFSECIL